YHRRAYNSYPRVILGARQDSTCPIAIAGPEGCLLWCDLLRILNLPGKECWALLVNAEELAHAYLISSQHPTHTTSAPEKRLDSSEFKDWDRARENAMKEVLYQWPFDRAEHETVLKWAIETSGGLKAAITPAT